MHICSSDTPVIKCAQCGERLIVPEWTEYVDESGYATSGNASLAITPLRLLLRPGSVARLTTAAER